jgi:hypothetical protein
MKPIVSAFLLVAALAGTAAAAEKPNFSGEWKMNAAKTNFGPLPPPTSIVRKVTHTEPSLIIVEEQQGDLGTQNTTRKYTTDGKETSFEANGAEVKGSAVWDGNVIVVTSSVDAVGLKFIDRMTLSDDGRTLTSVVHVASPQGELDITIVFDKQ